MYDFSMISLSMKFAGIYEIISGMISSRGWSGALEAFVLRLTNIRVCMELLGAFDARKGVG